MIVPGQENNGTDRGAGQENMGSDFFWQKKN
jgi:hypothetical protein